MTPIHDLICDVFLKDLVPEFLNASKWRVMFIYDDVPFLKEDETELHTRIGNDWKNGFITLDEARAGARYTPDVTGRGQMYYNEFLNSQNSNNNQQSGGDNNDETETDDTKSGSASGQ